MSMIYRLVAFFSVAVYSEIVSENWRFNLEEIVSFSLSLCDADWKQRMPFDVSSHPSTTMGKYDGRDGFAAIDASIPGSVHLDLMSNGIITSDPYYRFEELNMSWIPRLCWMYESMPFSFPVEAVPFRQDVTITFDAIDAPAVVLFNGITLGIAQNVHRKHLFRLDDRWIHSDRNVLTIQFPSSLHYAKAKADLYPYEVPATINYNVWAEPTSRNFVRKAGSDFGWDWLVVRSIPDAIADLCALTYNCRGPAFLNLGIRGHIEVSRYFHKLEGIFVEQDISLDYREADLHIFAFVASIDEFEKQVFRKFEVSVNGKVEVIEEKNIVCRSNERMYSASGSVCKVRLAVVRLRDLKLWWPRGYGDVYLYEIMVRMLNEDDIQTIRRRIGLRRVDLIQELLPSNNSTADVLPASFYIRVNGVPVFVKGANFIPIDSFPSRISRADREYVLRAAVAANMNMIRIWLVDCESSSDVMRLMFFIGEAECISRTICMIWLIN